MFYVCRKEETLSRCYTIYAFKLSQVFGIVTSYDAVLSGWTVNRCGCRYEQPKKCMSTNVCVEGTSACNLWYKGPQAGPNQRCSKSNKFYSSTLTDSLIPRVSLLLIIRGFPLSEFLFGAAGSETSKVVASRYEIINSLYTCWRKASIIEMLIACQTFLFASSPVGGLRARSCTSCGPKDNPSVCLASFTDRFVHS